MEKEKDPEPGSLAALIKTIGRLPMTPRCRFFQMPLKKEPVFILRRLKYIIELTPAEGMSESDAPVCLANLIKTYADDSIQL